MAAAYVLMRFASLGEGRGARGGAEATCRELLKKETLSGEQMNGIVKQVGDTTDPPCGATGGGGGCAVRVVAGVLGMPCGRAYTLSSFPTRGSPWGGGRGGDGGNWQDLLKKDTLHAEQLSCIM